MNDATNDTRCSFKWWLIWVIAFLVSLLPPVVFHWRSVSDIIEPLRFAGMLLPADLLMFRWLGELSHWIPGILLVFAFLARRTPTRAKSIICSGALLTGVFSSLYASYSILIASLYIEGYTDTLRRLHQAEQVDAAQPAIAVESKVEGNEKPKPESEGRSQ